MPDRNNAPKRDIIEQVPFSVTARVALQLGRESISSSVVALLELVKNSYDADADNVWITFVGLDASSPFLVIEDDGDGMTQQQLTDQWMVIGTDSKVHTRDTNVKRRALVGEKGLGRLGLDRLCSTTLVQSFTRRDDTGLELEIDWRKYERLGGRLEEITHPMYRIPKLIPKFDDGGVRDEVEYKEKGLRLILRNLKDDWRSEDLRKLRAELALLVSPFADISDFSVWLLSNKGLPDVDGKVSSEDMVEAAEWRVVSAIDADGNVSHSMSSARYEKQFTFAGPWAETFRDTGVTVPRCGPVSFQFYFMSRQEIEALSFRRAQVQSFLEANQGIRIYRDGFRVKPYGEPSGDGDWLNLSYRRIQSPQGVGQTPGTWRVGYNQIVGAVFISRGRNPTLLDQTNREGLIEGPPLHDLRRFALHSIRFFEMNRQSFELDRPRAQSGLEAAEGSAEAASLASSGAVEELKQAITTTLGVLEADADKGEDQEPSKVRSLLVQAVAKLDRAVQDTQKAHKQLTQASEKQRQELERQKNTLGNLASLGILAATFGHETLGASNIVVSNALLLRENVGQLIFVEPHVSDRIAENVENIEYGARKIETFAHFMLENIKRDKRQRGRLFVDQVAKKVLSSFAKVLEQERGIRVIPEYADKIRPIQAFHIDWESIFVNLITNAVWALEDTPRSSRVIRIRIRTTDERVLISFADSGRGIEAGTEDFIFMPTFSTKRNARGDIIGTGMGLAIVQNFVESYNGTIRVESRSDLGGAEFHLQIPIVNPSIGGKK